MPIYAYKCSECGHPVEVLQKISDAPLVECPNCHRLALVKQLTAAGFQLKGSGWYVTDFRDKAPGKKEVAKTESPTESKSDSGTASPPSGKEGSPAPAPAADSAPAKAPSPPPPSPSSSGNS
jgi:putative FmdB family regulatory protein